MYKCWVWVRRCSAVVLEMHGRMIDVSNDACPLSTGFIVLIMCMCVLLNYVTGFEVQIDRGCTYNWRILHCYICSKRGATQPKRSTGPEIQLHQARGFFSRWQETIWPGGTTTILRFNLAVSLFCSKSCFVRIWKIGNCRFHERLELATITKAENLKFFSLQLHQHGDITNRDD